MQHRPRVDAHRHVAPRRLAREVGDLQAERERPDRRRHACDPTGVGVEGEALRQGRRRRRELPKVGRAAADRLDAGLHEVREPLRSVPPGVRGDRERQDHDREVEGALGDRADAVGHADPRRVRVQGLRRDPGEAAVRRQRKARRQRAAGELERVRLGAARGLEPVAVGRVELRRLRRKRQHGQRAPPDLEAERTDVGRERHVARCRRVGPVAHLDREAEPPGAPRPPAQAARLRVEGQPRRERPARDAPREGRVGPHGLDDGVVRETGGRRVEARGRQGDQVGGGGAAATASSAAAPGEEDEKGERDDTEGGSHGGEPRPPPLGFASPRVRESQSRRAAASRRSGGLEHASRRSPLP